MDGVEILLQRIVCKVWREVHENMAMTRCLNTQTLCSVYVRTRRLASTYLSEFPQMSLSRLGG